MQTVAQHWRVAPAASPSFFADLRDMSPAVAQTLYNRGFADARKAHTFLHASDPADGQMLRFKTSGERKSKPIHTAIARINRAIAKGELIVVYGDFDADGVTSTVLLVQVLRALGAQVKPYIPHRVDEGYGLNSEALLKLKKAGASLVITVDCGIRSVEEVEAGNTYGLDLIITDHHSLGDTLPRALSVINPKCDDCHYTEPMLAGVGVAYRLAEALLTVAGNRRQNGTPLPTPNDLLDLVAIGTIADLAPLDKTENRALVRRGLQVLNEAKRPGVRALLDLASVRLGSIDAQTVGYIIGPRINAAGRLESAMLAYELLSADDATLAKDRAEKLQALNTERQALTRAAQDAIRQQLEVDDALDAPLIFAGGDFREGIVGLVAGRLTEEFYRPTIVMHHGREESRASCRSIPEFDITHALDQCADLLVRHGGHAQAAGFTVRNENLKALKQRLLGLASEALGTSPPERTLHLDAEVELTQVDVETAESLRLLEPCGQANNAPTFASFNTHIVDRRLVGRENQHLKLWLKRPNMPPVEAIGFNMADHFPHGCDHVDVAYALETHEYKDVRSVQLRLEAIRPASR